MASRKRRLLINQRGDSMTYLPEVHKKNRGQNGVDRGEFNLACATQLNSVCVTYLEKIKTIAVGSDVSHIKDSQWRSHQNNSGISVVPTDHPTL